MRFVQPFGVYGGVVFIFAVWLKKKSAYEREAKLHHFAKDYEVAAKHVCERFKVTTTNFAKDPRSKRPILRKILGQ